MSMNYSQRWSFPTGINTLDNKDTVSWCQDYNYQTVAVFIKKSQDNPALKQRFSCQTRDGQVEDALVTTLFLTHNYLIVFVSSCGEWSYCRKGEIQVADTSYTSVLLSDGSTQGNEQLLGSCLHALCIWAF